MTEDRMDGGPAEPARSGFGGHPFRRAPVQSPTGRLRMDMRRLWRDNGLTIVLLAVFALSMIGQLVTGWRAASTDAGRHGEAAPGLAAYLVSGEFLSAVFENWESEFLEMAAQL